MKIVYERMRWEQNFLLRERNKRHAYENCSVLLAKALANAKDRVAVATPVRGPGPLGQQKVAQRAGGDCNCHPLAFFRRNIMNDRSLSTVIVKPCDDLCDMACDYCYFLNKAKPSRGKRTDGSSNASGSH